jgi:uncharacterized protein (TIGR00369 family)
MGLGSLLLDVAPRSERASVDVRNTPARAVDARLVGQGSVDRELGTELIAAAADSLTATFVARPRFANMRGMLHGGFGACFGERVLDLALAHRSEAEHGLRLADLRVTYLRGIPADDRALPCHAAVAYAGRRFATARGEVFDGDDRVAVMVEASYVSATSAAVPGPR